MLERADRVALLRRVSVRRGHSPRRRGQPGAEDASRRRRRRQARGLAIVQLPAPVERDRLPAARPGRTGSTAPSAAEYDFIILPGSKNTIADLQWLRSVGLADWILAQHRRRRDGHRHLRRLPDAGPADRRSDRDRVRRSDPRRAWACFPSTTTLTREKQTRAVRATHARRRDVRRLRDPLGVTDARSPAAPMTPFATLEDGTADGVRGDRRDRHLPARRARAPGGLRRGLRRCDAVASQTRPCTTSDSRTGSSSTGAIWIDWGSTDYDRDRNTCSWECLRAEPFFDLRRAGRFLVAELKGAHHVLSTSVRHGG